MLTTAVQAQKIQVLISMLYGQKHRASRVFFTCFQTYRLLAQMEQVHLFLAFTINFQLSRQKSGS